MTFEKITINNIDIVIDEAKETEPNYHRIIYFAKEAKWMIYHYKTLYGVGKRLKYDRFFYGFVFGVIIHSILTMIAI